MTWWIWFDYSIKILKEKLFRFFLENFVGLSKSPHVKTLWSKVEEECVARTLGGICGRSDSFSKFLV